MNEPVRIIDGADSWSRWSRETSRLFQRFVARQLGNPSTLVGTLFLAPLWNRRNAALNDSALRSLCLGVDDRVLEIGFGGGYLLGRMAAVVTNGSVAGVDVSSTMVAFCARRYQSLVKAGKLEIRQGQAESLPYPDGRFTRVCSVNSVFYWSDAARGIAEAWRVLSPDGILVICFTLPSSLKHRGFAEHIGLYDVDDIRRVMETSGFRDIVVERSSDKHREFACVVGKKRPLAG